MNILYSKYFSKINNNIKFYITVLNHENSVKIKYPK